MIDSDDVKIIMRGDVPEEPLVARRFEQQGATEGKFGLESNNLTEDDIYYAPTELADITATAFSQKGMATLASLARTLTRPLVLQFQPMSGKPIGAIERSR